MFLACKLFFLDSLQRIYQLFYWGHLGIFVSRVDDPQKYTSEIA